MTQFRHIHCFTRFLSPLFAGALLLFISGCDVTEPPLETQIPPAEHIVVVIFENKAVGEIVDTSAAPYLNELKNDDQSAFFINSYSMGHPSQPNYIYFFSGDNQGIYNNEKPPFHFTTPNLGAELLDKGLTFKTYAEGLPYPGYDGDSSGTYARKHNPAANWTGKHLNQFDSLLIRPFSEFPQDFDDLPTVSFVIPDMQHSMHDASIQTGDTWLEENLSDYIQYAKTHNSLCIITFDETSYAVTDNKIYTVFIGKKIIPGEYSEAISHISILRTIEDMYKLRHAGYSNYLHGINGCWE